MSKYAERRKPPEGGFKHLNEVQVAELLNLSERTLQGWRVTGKGPTFEKFGRSVRYATTAVEAWIAAQERASTTAASPPGLYNIPRDRPLSDCERGEWS